jgi:hypothetical protein
MAPNWVDPPVATTTQRAAPLCTLVPRNTQFARWASVAEGATGAALFSTGKLSPVSIASPTKKSFASRITASAGTRLPAERSTRSPGTISWRGTVTGVPSRITRARERTRAPSAAAAVCALYSLTYPIAVAATTTAKTMPASIHSAVSADAAAAKTSSSRRGLLSWRARTPSLVSCGCSRSALGP